MPDHQRDVATMEPGDAPYGLIPDAAIAVRGGRIAWVGPEAELPAAPRAAGARPRRPAGDAGADRLPHPRGLRRQPRARVRDAARRRELRGGRPRRRRHRRRRCARPAPPTRPSCSPRALPRVDALIAEGVATIEIKSGYGLDARDRAAHAARRARDRPPAPGAGAHQLSRRARGAAKAATPTPTSTTVCIPALRAAARRGPGRRRRRLLRGHRLHAGAGRARSSPPRASSACRSSSTPSSSRTSAARGWPRAYGALSADHLEYLDEAGVRGDGRGRAPSR